MANNVNLPAQGTGDTTPRVSTDQVSADSSQVQNFQLASVAGGVLTRNPTIPVSLASVPTHAVTGTVTAAMQPATTATLTNVSSSASNVANLVALNTNRLGLVIFNDSTQILYLKFGTTASATSFTYQLAASQTLELPAAGLIYTGRIDGIWASANGNARVTELSA